MNRSIFIKKTGFKSKPEYFREETFNVETKIRPYTKRKLTAS